MKMPGGVRAKSVEPLKCARKNHTSTSNNHNGRARSSFPVRTGRRDGSQSGSTGKQPERGGEGRETTPGWVGRLLQPQSCCSRKRLLAFHHHRFMSSPMDRDEPASVEIVASAVVRASRTQLLGLTPTCTPLAHDASCIHNTTTPQHECLWGLFKYTGGSDDLLLLLGFSGRPAKEAVHAIPNFGLAPHGEQHDCGQMDQAHPEAPACALTVPSV